MAAARGAKESLARAGPPRTSSPVPNFLGLRSSAFILRVFDP